MVFTLLAEVWVHNGSPSIRFCECRSIFGCRKKNVRAICGVDKVLAYSGVTPLVTVSNHTFRLLLLASVAELLHTAGRMNYVNWSGSNHCELFSRLFSHVSPRYVSPNANEKTVSTQRLLFDVLRMLIESQQKIYSQFTTSGQLGCRNAFSFQTAFHGISRKWLRYFHKQLSLSSCWLTRSHCAKRKIKFLLLFAEIELFFSRLIIVVIIVCLLLYIMCLCWVRERCMTASCVWRAKKRAAQFVAPLAPRFSVCAMVDVFLCVWVLKNALGARLCSAMFLFVVCDISMLFGLMALKYAAVVERVWLCTVVAAHRITFFDVCVVSKHLAPIHAYWRYIQLYFDQTRLNVCKHGLFSISSELNLWLVDREPGNFSEMHFFHVCPRIFRKTP